MRNKINPKFKVRLTTADAIRSGLIAKGGLGREPLALSDAGPACADRSDGPSATGRLTDALSGPLGALVFKDLRVRPRQARSIESVERILSTAADMVHRQRRLEGISIEKISTTAGVTPQAAYRYFKDARELVETGLRCVVVREHERLITQLSDRLIADEPGMAKLVVSVVVHTCERICEFPPHIHADLIREYRQVGYDAAPLLSEIICKDVDDRDIRSTIDVFKVSVALAATIAVATSFFFDQRGAEGRGRLEDMLTSLFLSVLQSGGRSSDAFREIGCRFGDLWGSEVR